MFTAAYCSAALRQFSACTSIEFMRGGVRKTDTSLATELQQRRNRGNRAATEQQRGEDAHTNRALARDACCNRAATELQQRREDAHTNRALARDAC